MANIAFSALYLAIYFLAEWLTDFSKVIYED